MAQAGYPAWDEDEAFFDERPARRVRRRSVPWFRTILMSGLTIGGLVYFALQNTDEHQATVRKAAPSPALIAPAPVWTPVDATPALYAVDRSFGAPIAEARRNTGGAREDILTLGRFGDARHGRIALIQGAGEPARSFFVDIVRRAAEAGLAVSRTAQSRMVATKFGPVEVSGMTLLGTGEQECQAFRFADPDSGFGFQGWLCGGDPVPNDAQLACFIDGIGLSGAAGPSLKALFVRVEKYRTDACGAFAYAASAGVRPPPRP